MRFINIALIALLSFQANAEWQLDNQQSELSFVAIKDAHVADNHYFTDLKGFVNKDGTAELIINTASVETSITKRNQRLKDLFFKTGAFPEAKVSLSVRRSLVKDQPPGTSNHLNVTAMVNLLGVSLQQQARINVVHLLNGNVEVSTIEPILIDSEDYGLLPAIHQLTALAGLKTISVKIPVSFRLVFIKSSI